MSKKFVHDGMIYAVWNTDVGSLSLFSSAGDMSHAVLPAFIAWLQEGPPKKRYRITRTFDTWPDYVQCLDKPPWTTLNVPLEGSDLEEVWE